MWRSTELPSLPEQLSPRPSQALDNPVSALPRFLVNASIAVLLNGTNPNAISDEMELHAAARTLSQSINVLKATTDKDVEAIFATLADCHVSAMLVNTDPYFLAIRDRFVSLATRYAVPTLLRRASTLLAPSGG
jgi:5-methylthioribose kinase